MNNRKKMATPLLTHYNNLTVNQQSDLKQYVSDELGKLSRTTLRNWLKGISEPTLREKKAIAEFLKVNQEVIFPTNK